MKKIILLTIACTLVAFSAAKSALAETMHEHQREHELEIQLAERYADAPDVYDGMDGAITSLACRKASSSQMEEVNRGNSKLNKFLSSCSSQTKNSAWCKEIIRPNPASKLVFQCTYGAKQAHTLVHPDESTWKNAIKAVQLVQSLQDKGIKPCQIYNWWRPEPYNANVGGAAGRHPFGTSIDVRFCSIADMEKAFKQLCLWRKQGSVKAVGYYGSTGLHLGVGDRVGNTWGKTCPK